MAKLNHHKVTVLPGVLEANAIYFVELANNRTDLYVTDINGVAHTASNVDFINAIIDTRRGAANGIASLDSGGKVPASQLPFTLNDATDFLIVANITARDALVLDRNALVLVIDASADATVTAGNALYAWDDTAGTWSKVTEFESLDITWDGIQGRPNVTAVQIEQAVADSHTHANAVQLAKIGEDGDGDITYDGDPVAQWKTNAW